MNKGLKAFSIFLVTVLFGAILVFVSNMSKEQREGSVNTNDVVLKIGEAYKIGTSEIPAIYESADPSVATVDGTTGIVTATGAGTTKITVKTEDESVEFIIKVDEDSEKNPKEEKTTEIINDMQDISNAIISSVADQVYTGYPLTPEIIVMLGENKLENTVDYSVGYSDNTNIGTATITITGIGNYKGSKKITFKIDGIEYKETAKKPAEITCNDKSYNGFNQIIASCSGGTLQDASQKDVGEYEVSCIGDDSHTDAVNKKCTISQTDISGVDVSVIANQIYTGKALTPSITINHGTISLEKDTDYIIEYKNNTNEGTATIEVTGIGNYSGTKQITFKITKNQTKAQAVITCTNKSYNGKSQTIAACSGGTISNASQTKVGNYNITCKGDSNHTDATKKTCAVTKISIANTIISSIANQTYTGKALTPAITVKLSNTTLKKDTDYTVSYNNNTKEGTATVTITGKGNYEGTKKATFKIVKAPQTKTQAVITCFNKTYNGAAQTIATCSGGTIKNASQTNVGSYDVTCTGDSSHTNATQKTCKIERASIVSATIAGIAEQLYTGKEIKPTVSITNGSVKLKQGTDYTVSYSNNIKIGTATVTITGKGNYQGTRQKTFIIAKEKTPAKITCANKTYNGLSQTIATCSGGTIKNATQTNVGSYTITCTGDSSHKNAANTECSITQGDISKSTVAGIANKTYTGSPITPAVTVKIGTLTLKKDTDYTVSYSNNTNAGIAKVIITGKGNYKGTKQVTFNIVKPAVITCLNKAYTGASQVIASCEGGTISNATQTKVGSYTISCKGDGSHIDATNKSCSIAKANASTFTITVPSENLYTGKAITPTVTVKKGSTVLKKDTDYTVSYSNNINVGTANVTVTGKGNYQGTKSATFKIVKSLTKAVSSITLDKTSLSISSNGKAKLTPKILPADATDKSITWTSSDPIIARVDSNGNVVAVKPGTATITAKTKNGKTATCKITVTSPNKTIASYDSSTLKYWIEYVSEPTKQKTHKGNKINVQSTYMITHLWVSDPYNQVKTAITPKKSSSQTAEYPRLTQAGSTLINNEIKAKGYQSKGLIAVNATGMVTHTKDKNGKDVGWCTTCPLDYYGTSIMPLQIYEGRVIRDSTNTKYATIGDGRVMFVNKDGNIIYKKFTSDLTKNKTLRSEVTSEGAKYTFGGVSPYLIVSNYKKTLTSANSVATRQGLCQIDEHNFVLITSHLNGESAESSCGKSSALQCPRIVHGLSVLDLAEIMESLGCKIGFNLDGGGSVSYFYKTNKTSEATRVKIAAAQRGLSDMLYFVEK